MISEYHQAVETNDRICLIAVGTELTDGQILNRNTQWMAQKLTELGFSVFRHVTVPDDRREILHVLKDAQNWAKWIFVCGGLGPTSDDFTRQVISAWAEAPLQWDEESWQRIVERVNRFNVPMAESNRQQCYFPKGSQILPNSEGTASGFRLNATWVFPGPPRELAAVWEAHVSPFLEQSAPKSSLQLATWQCIGLSEAALGELTEKTLNGSGLKIGYRVHIPYVEVKVWFKDSAEPWLESLTQVLRPWTLSRKEEDFAVKFMSWAGSRGLVVIEDHATFGLLARRLGDAHANLTKHEVGPDFMITTALQGTSFTETSLRQHLSSQPLPKFLWVLGAPDSNGTWLMGFRTENEIQIRSMKTPYRSAGLRTRNSAFITEMSLHQCLEIFGPETLGS